MEMAIRALKTATELAFLVAKGSRFQSRIVLEDNEYCLEVVLGR